MLTGVKDMDIAIPTGYRFAGVSCGIKEKPDTRDLTLLVSDRDASVAGVFTTNRVCAAPVRICRQRVPASAIRGVVVNSGNANACTGAQGIEDAERATARLAEHLGCDAAQTLVCSTGVIGRPLPMDKITAGVDAAFAQLAAGAEAFGNAAHGILTTDTRVKVAGRSIRTPGGTVQVTGIAKGAAMIGPNMATMLAFVLTDARADPATLDDLLRPAVDSSFHCIGVEGHTSTNDTVLLLANGASGIDVSDDPDAPFARALREVCADLARAIVDDAEGITHLITIDVSGLPTEAEARRVAKTVADSALVKTAIFGNDPNWGRICSAAGYAGVDFAESDLSLRVNGTLLYDRGAPTSFDEAAESANMKRNRDTHVELIFTLGEAKRRFWTCDLSNEYVRLNADYTT